MQIKLLQTTNTPWRTPVGIALLYASLALLWIIASDYMLTRLAGLTPALRHLSTIKGILFVAVTCGLLYLLLRNWHGSLQRAMTEALQYKDRLERALQGANDGWWDWDLERDHLYYSPRWWTMLGFAENELPADSRLWQRLVHPDERQRILQTFDAALRSGESSFSVEQRLLHKEGHYVPVLTRYHIARDANGTAVRASGTNMDISYYKQTEARLRQAATVFETTREGVMVTDREQRIVMVNHAFSAISGYAESEVLGQPVAILDSGRHDSAFHQAICARLEDEGHWQGEVWKQRKNGEVYPELLSISAVRNHAGAITNYVSVFADISKLKAVETRADFLAHHDTLTQLPNRQQFTVHLQHAIDVARAQHHALAVLMVDLDRFKDINESFGHANGDCLLQQVADQISSHIPDGSKVARLGGDEFAVILDNISEPQQAAHRAARLLEVLNAPWVLPNGAEVRTSASIGISLFPQHADCPNDLLQHADAALYQAKAAGRKCFRFFSDNLVQAARARVDLEARLHRALDRGELMVFYQPQVDIGSGRIVGAEALVRWRDPAEGMILPSRFIPVAESSGLIGAIGEWVLRQTCRQGQQWLRAGLSPVRLSVNLSARQLLHSDLDAMVSAVLAETDFPAAQLELELTESALMERERDVAQQFHRLRELGVRVAIDDFGTGYSSLAHLKRFPLDVLKIDKSFIDDIPERQSDMEIAAAIIAMGRTLGFTIVAEGVETPAQLGFLQERGCDLYQGYLSSPPLPADEFAALLIADHAQPALASSGIRA